MVFFYVFLCFFRACEFETIYMYLIFFSDSDSEKGKDGSWNAFDFFVVFVSVVDLTMDYVSEKLGFCSFCMFCFAVCCCRRTTPEPGLTKPPPNSYEFPLTHVLKTLSSETTM